MLLRPDCFFLFFQVAFTQPKGSTVETIFFTHNRTHLGSKQTLQRLKLLVQISKDKQFYSVKFLASNRYVTIIKDLGKNNMQIFMQCTSL